MSESPRTLGTVQEWFQAVVTHPDGVEGGVQSEEAQALIRLPRGELEAVICRSRNLTASERIGIYANAYYAPPAGMRGRLLPAAQERPGRGTFSTASPSTTCSAIPRGATRWTTGRDFPPLPGRDPAGSGGRRTAARRGRLAGLPHRSGLAGVDARQGLRRSREPRARPC